MLTFSDPEALLKSLCISVGIGLVLQAVAYLALRGRKGWLRWKPAIILVGIGLVLVLAVLILPSQRTTVVVPALGGLGQAEAEDALSRNGLRAGPRPQYVAGTPVGRVVPGSQSPAPDLRVRPGQVVSFAVSAVDVPQSASPVEVNHAVPVVRLFQPKAGESVRPAAGPDGVYRLSVRGACSGLAENGFQLLLWVRPVRPPAETVGWYLQRPPVNGISRIDSDGSWSAVAQIGNAQWPPHEGDVLDIAVTIVDGSTASRLMAEAGVVVMNQPLGVSVDNAAGLIVTLK